MQTSGCNIAAEKRVFHQPAPTHNVPTPSGTGHWRKGTIGDVLAPSESSQGRCAPLPPATVHPRLAVEGPDVWVVDEDAEAEDLGAVIYRSRA